MIGKTMTGKAIDGNAVTGLTAVLARSSGMASAMHMVPLALIGFYLMFAPVWAPLFTSRLYDDARYMQLGLLAVMVVFLALPRIRDGVLSVWNDLGRRVQTLWVVFLVGGIASAVFSESPDLAALELGLVTQLAFLTLLICALVRQNGISADKSLAVAVCAGAALICLQFWLMQAISIFEGRRFSWAHPFLEFANVRFFSQYQSYVLFLLPVPMLLLRLSWKWKTVLYVVAANFWALQWMVGTRAVWIAFAAAMLAVCVMTRSGRVAFVRTHLLLVLAGGIVFAGYLGATATTGDVTRIPQKLSVMKRGSGSVNERVLLVREAVGAIVDKPLTGVGPGQFGLMKYPLRAAHPHNAPLQLMSEYGLVAGGAGIVLGLTLLIFALRSMRAAEANGQDAITVSLAAALVMGLVESLFSGGIIMPHGQMMLCIVAGWLLGRRLTASDQSVRSEGGSQMRLALTLSVVAAALVTTLVSFEYWSVVRDMPISAQRWHPHFWQYGRFSDW
jgi:O-antigen ligase